VAVTGATGGVGSLAVDMLSDLGYEVTAITGKREERAYLEKLGASVVLLRQELEMGGRPLEKARRAGAVDTVGTRSLGGSPVPPRRTAGWRSAATPQERSWRRWCSASPCGAWTCSE
jgi:NAD(P)-dependent dehydrogenase (short-subunit alcohol dehydrogenase family)